MCRQHANFIAVHISDRPIEKLTILSVNQPARNNVPDLGTRFPGIINSGQVTTALINVLTLDANDDMIANGTTILTSHFSSPSLPSQLSWLLCPHSSTILVTRF
jgi:hypothetical protein